MDAQGIRAEACESHGTRFACLRVMTRLRSLDLQIAGCGLAIALTLVGWLIPVSPGYRSAILVSFLVGGFMLAAMFFRYQQTQDLLDPLILVTSALFFYFCVHTLYLAFRPATQVDRPYSSGLAPSLLVFGLGYLLLLVGFWMRPSKPPSKWLAGADREIPEVALMLLFLLGTAAQLYGVMVGLYAKLSTQVTSTQNFALIGAASSLTLVALVLAVAQYYRRRALGNPHRPWLALAMLALIVGFGLAVGHKTVVIEAGFSWLAARHYAYRRVRLRSVVAGLAFFTFLITPLVQSGRQGAAANALNEQGSATEVRATLGSLPARMLDLLRHPRQTLDGWTEVNQRSNGSESLALAYLYAGHVDAFQHGRTWVAIPLTFIPNELWRGKPSFNQTLDFSEIYGGQSPNSGGGLTLSPTIPGDLWVNFGWLGLIGGLFVLGIFLSWLRDQVHFGSAAPAILIYVLIALVLVHVEHHVAIYTSLLLLQLAIGAATLAGLGWLATTGDPTTPRLVEGHRNATPAARHLHSQAD
jgi:hypothetical protein